LPVRVGSDLRIRSIVAGVRISRSVMLFITL
jgi:acyl dehydratase